MPGLKIAINELRRTSNTVTLKFTVYNGTDNNFRTQGVFDGDDYHRYRHLGGVHLIDTQSKKKYFVVTANIDAQAGLRAALIFRTSHLDRRSWFRLSCPAPPDDVQKLQ